MKRKSIPIILASALAFAALSSCGGEEHQYASEWSKDASDHWHACTLENHTDVADKGAHDFDNGKVTKQATEDAEGVKTYTCNTCSYEKYEPIAKLPHTHTFDSTQWASDEESHWHPSTCGHDEEKDALASHVWDEGEVTTPATEEAEGVKTYTCTICEETKEEAIAKLPHTHTFDMTTWSKDESGHWHAATCEHTDQKKDFAEHSGTWAVKQEATYTQNRIEQRDCEVCDYHEEKEIEGTILPAQERELSVEEIANVTFDGLSHALPDGKIIRTNDEGGLTVEYREKGKETYATEAPVEAGTYEYRVTLKGTAQWKEKTANGEFVIEPLKVILSDTAFEDPVVDPDYISVANIYTTEDGSDISTATNGWADCVSVLAPSSYGEAGRHTIPAAELYLDDDNFVLDTGSIESISVVKYDSKDFIAGVTESWFITGKGAAVNLKIEQGTVGVGDTIYICELDKETTVTSIEIGGKSQSKVTVGDEASLLLGDIAKGEIKTGMVLSKPDTVKKHRSAMVTMELYDAKTAGRSYAYVVKDCPTFAFYGTSVSASGRIVSLPSGVTSISSGETVEDICVDFSSSAGNWPGRKFYIKDGTKIIGEGTINGTHDHAFDSDGACACGVSNVTAGTWDSGKCSFADRFYLGEERAYTCDLSAPSATDATYSFALLDSNGDSFTEGFEFKVYSTLTGKEVPLNSGSTCTVSKRSTKPIKVVVTKTGGSVWFEYCQLLISIVL